MPIPIKKICECMEQLNHSKVVDSRFRWAKEPQQYIKHRRRVCNKCHLGFTTIEISKSEMKIIMTKVNEFEKLIIKSQKLMIKLKQQKPESKPEPKQKEITGQKNLSNYKINFNNMVNKL